MLLFKTVCVRLCAEAADAFKKYALAGPEVSSPSIANTSLELVNDCGAEPSPEVISSKSAALVEPSKTGLTAYDRMMLDLESTLNKFIKQLDKDIREAEEKKEKERIMKEQLEKRMQKKREALEEATKKGRQVGDFTKTHFRLSPCI